MASREIDSLIKATIVLGVQAITSDTLTFGAINVDTAGFESIEFLFFNSNIHADGDYELIPRAGDTTVVANHIPVPADELTVPQIDRFILNSVGINQIIRMGYIGKKRFISADIRSTNVTTGATLGCSLVLNTARHGPVDRSFQP